MTARVTRELPSLCSATVAAFEGCDASNEPLLRAAAARVCDLVGGEGAAVAVSPAPLALARQIAAAGVRAVALPATAAEIDLLDALLQQGIVPVVEGAGDAAIALAAFAKPAGVIIYTAGKAVMSADPSRIAGAAPVAFASHVELLELAEPRASAGLVRAAQDAHRSGISYQLRSLTGDGGTIVRNERYEDRSRPITSISVSGGFALISVRPREGEEDGWSSARAECLERLASAGVSVEMLQFVPARMRFVVGDTLARAAQDVVRDCGLAWRYVPSCAKLCVVGAGIRTTAGVFFRTLRGLSELEIPVLHFSDSNVTISLIVPEAQGARAETFLHEVLSTGASSFGSPISFDAARCRVRVNGQERRLGARQARLLEFLIENVGRVVKVEEAARHVLGGDGKDEIAALRVHMHNLRKKIEEDPDNPRYVVTVPAQGYLFVR